MKENTKEELLLITNDFWQALADRNIEKRFLHCADSVTFIGTGLEEKAFGKLEYVAINQKGIEQYPEKFKLNILWQRVSVIEDMGWVESETEWIQMINGKEEMTLIRNTIVLKKIDAQWKIVHVHGSVPDFRLAGQNYITNAETIKINRELEKEVYQRTKELNAKNRELEIESSLERVRTVAMGMRKPDDMLGVCQIIAEQLNLLGIKDIRNVQTAIVEGRDDGFYMNYQYFQQYGEGIIEDVEIAKHPSVVDMIRHMKQSPDAFFSHSFEGDELEKWKQYRKDDRQFPDPILEQAKSVHFYFYSIGKGGLGLSAYTPLTEDKIAVFHRFRNVFALAYQRFRDIEHAEVQLREAQIEAAMERVRGRTMAMQKSDELSEVIKLIYQELDKLNASNSSMDIEIGLLDEETGIAAVWAHLYQSDGTIATFNFPLSYFEDTRDEWIQWKNTPIDQRNSLFITTIFVEEQLQRLFSSLTSLPELEVVFQPLIDAGIEKWVTHNAYFSHGLLTLQGTEAYSPEILDIQKRLTKVFEQTYIRFLDLQKAEANARESKIEIALERVRSRSMAMQRSEELADVVKLIYQELDKLQINNESTDIEIGLIDEETGVAATWAHFYQSDGTISTFNFPLARFEETNNEFQQWKATPVDQRNQLFFTTEFSKDLWQRFSQLASEMPELAAIFQPLAEANIDKWVTHNAYFSHGFLTLQGIEAYSLETQEIQKRFAKVFEQTYIRFLDLQKAEAQAREAQIEASLERVRSVALGMRKANDLLDICEALYTELEKLDFSGLRNTMINILDDSKASFLNYDYSPEVGRSITSVLYSTNELIENQIKTLKTSDDAFVEHVLQGKQLDELIEMRKSQGEADDPRLHCVNAVSYYFYSIGVGAIGISSFNTLTEEQRILLRRFRNVFEFAYRRYMDIAQAEANAREAQIEAGLERVRSRTMAMQSCDELAETASVVLNELVKLGIAPSRLYIAIIENDTTDVHFYLTSEEGGKDCSVYTAQIERNITIRKMYNGWADHRSSLSLNMEGAELTSYFNYLRDEVGVPFRSAQNPSRRVQTIAYFSQGYIGIASPDDQPEETTKLLERFAAVFNLTYTRFNDLKQAEKLAHQANLDLIRLKEEKARTEVALAELKAAQAQLIQAEKMASLGELTAGIAHEIQNPLNFVNNFSEVNTELIEEMREELQSGNTEEAISIANDIAENEQKINHHGKRADAIVKGMLQHSRTSSGVKEPTDINALADEYLRLAYHGLRAKDKTFNASMKTDFDPSIGKVDIIPQDIGRVILNLITNAFYAVNEKQKSLLTPTLIQTPYPLTRGVDYIPTVIVRTKKHLPLAGGRGLNEANPIGYIEITVTDNGNGIPQSALDKIFQPFFTTKPTGQGTGLGLSLSYDIVKAHGGELKVETKEGEGTEFTIILPV
ncbi:MAG TPA: ATP-binding protein [Saprospiraceae bacterium]